MPDIWRLLYSPPARGAWNMAVDEAILEHIGRRESIPTLRLYAWQPACLSLGYAQPFADVDVARLKERGWEVVRRPTGGRAILHTDELTYSVIAPADEPRVAGSVLESYNRLAGALLEAVSILGLPVELKAEEGSNHETPNPVCFEVPSAYEITVNGKKLIGSAQARRREGVLQHGSLPLTGNLTRITEALTFADDAARLEAATRLLGRATTVESVLGGPAPWDEAARAIARAFELKFSLEFVDGGLTESEKERAEELVREKYDHPDWMARA
jgi:lipoate-protein ligase A